MLLGARMVAAISISLSRPWHKGHPGLILARRLQRKASQVWLFATRFDVPPTNNGWENAIRGYKLAVKISGCWGTLATLQRHSASAPTHHRAQPRPPPLAAIRGAFTGSTWRPPQQHDQLTTEPGRLGSYVHGGGLAKKASRALASSPGISSAMWWPLSRA